MEGIPRLLALIGITGARWVEENIDEQFKALKYLHVHLSDPDHFVRLVVANALVSYQLSGKGEEWWWEFARWFSKNHSKGIYEAFETFLPASRFNKRLTKVKLARLKRIENFLVSFDLERAYGDMLSFWKELANALGTKKERKTVVFAVKMFGYAMRVVGYPFHPYPMEIPIPLDSRIKKLTAGITNEDPIQFWQRVAEESGVPPLHIDSIIWPLFRESAREKFLEKFGDVGRSLLLALNLAR